MNKENVYIPLPLEYRGVDSANGVVGTVKGVPPFYRRAGPRPWGRVSPGCHRRVGPAPLERTALLPPPHQCYVLSTWVAAPPLTSPQLCGAGGDEGQKD